LLKSEILTLVLVFNYLSVILTQEKNIETGISPFRKNNPSGNVTYLDENKQKLVEAMQLAVGSPVTKGKIAEKFAGATGLGINRFAKFIIKQTETNYSESTVKAVINEVCA